MTEKDKVQSKVDIKIGDISFSAEGEPAWLSEQVAKVMEAAAKMPAAATAPARAASPGNFDGAAPTPSGGSLSSYIKAVGGEAKQVRRFLATAAWLFERDNAAELTASTIAKTLSKNHQKGLANAADCLNQNVGKGYCEKNKEGGFFITPEGWEVLGAHK